MSLSRFELEELADKLADRIISKLSKYQRTTT